MKKITLDFTKIFNIISVVMLLLAIPTIFPFWYFQVLRWVITGIAIINAKRAYNFGSKWWLFIMIAIAILFNPISQIYLEKQVWIFIDLITAIVMVSSIFNLKYQEGKQKITMDEKLRHYISIIVWITFSIICGLTFYVNHYLPHGPMYATGEIVCRNDDRGPCGEEYKEDMRGLNIPSWTKFLRSNGIGIIFILALVGVITSTKNKEPYE